MRALFCFFALLFLPVPAYPQQIILNELYNSSSTNEWVEIVVVQEGLDLRGWDLRDFSSGGSPQDPLEFLDVPLWSSLEAGTVIIAAKPDSALMEDLDPSDFTMLVKLDNKQLFDGALFLFAGTSDAIEIRNSNDEHVFGISWGTGNEGSLPEPRVHFSGNSTSNTAASFMGDSLSHVVSVDHWLWDNPSPTPGTANGPANSAWIDSLRAIVSGIHSPTDELPVVARLMQNYPNPFNSQTRISYTVGSPVSVVLKIHDVLGREIATVVNERKEIGTHSVTWDAAGISSGVYYYRLQAGSSVETKRLVLIR